ncbi:lipoprotein-releasing system ATP-binding protein LolD [Candidatus Fermentibacteria bacterium]|nr:MAG: lipoprotein-releasing system ATP-binding protein LolD [Candidatus Fermentibacteria bacterium]
MNESKNLVLSAVDIWKSYGKDATYLSIIRGAGIEVSAGEIVSIVGPSGSGKSTFLHVCGVLDPPDRGTVSVGSMDVWSVNESRRARIRNSELGFIFQFHHLLEEFTLQENVAMPSMLAGNTRRDALDSAASLLAEVGLSDRGQHFPSETSGGERQRAAVARALILSPSVVLADEPTGNLDAANSRIVEDLMFELADRRSQAFIIATHSIELAERAHRSLSLEDGVLH